MTRIVDVNTFFGQPADRNLDLSLEQLRHELTSHDVTDALTRSLSAIHYFDVAGNEETLAACA